MKLTLTSLVFVLMLSCFNAVAKEIPMIEEDVEQDVKDSETYLVLITLSKKGKALTVVSEVVEKRDWWDRGPEVWEAFEKKYTGYDITNVKRVWPKNYYAVYLIKKGNKFKLIDKKSKEDFEKRVAEVKEQKHKVIRKSYHEGNERQTIFASNDSGETSLYRRLLNGLNERFRAFAKECLQKRLEATLEDCRKLYSNYDKCMPPFVSNDGEIFIDVVQTHHPEPCKFRLVERSRGAGGIRAGPMDEQSRGVKGESDESKKEEKPPPAELTDQQTTLF